MLRTFASFLSFILIFTLTAAPAFAAKDGFAKGASTAELRKQYENDTIKILIASGHEPSYGGAVYQGVYEREIVAEIADTLEELLSNNPKYEVIVTRSNSSWNKALSKYFSKEKRSTQKFVKAQKKKMERLVKRGDVEKPGEGDQVDHATAPDDVALRLYGINRWANENDIDLVVNIHVNDATDHDANTPSKYTGFAVYVPDSAYGNSKTSKELGHDIVRRLVKLSDVSTLPGESGGVTEDQELIALGAYGTLNVPSVLIEYGYITEPRFTLPEHRQTVVKDTAYQTYLALQDFFNDEVLNPRSIAKLPTKWPEPVATTTPPIATTTPVAIVESIRTQAACTLFTDTLLPAKDDEVEATSAVERLQKILAKDKTVYPEGLVTGYFGPATLRAVQAFQKKNSIVSSGTPETTGYGAVGPRTAKVLMTLCSMS
ncbi:MAG TPA: N-acetylmuramoyl-L-alanine amidase [Candidatus Paceibacterota bacterium]